MCLQSNHTIDTAMAKTKQQQKKTNKQKSSLAVRMQSKMKSN